MPSYGWGKPIVGNVAMRIPAFESPNFVSGSQGWALFQDGTAQLNELTIIVQSTGAAILIYNGSVALGNLIGSWAGQAGVDSVGNAYPAGISAQQGVLNGTTINTATIVNAIISTPAITGGTIANAAISGGTITETKVTFDTGGGNLLVYASTTTTVTFSTPGVTTWTGPANVTSAKVECTGAGGAPGGDAGSGGGGGEYAQEPSYPITPGTIYSVLVGQGASGPSANVDGGAGGLTYFDNGGVLANGGSGGLASGVSGGAGGTGSTNTIHNNGGAGGASPGSNTGGGGGGGSGGSTGAGGTGGASSGSTGGSAGAAGTGGGAAGGAGGNSAANGSNGAAPGGGGGAGGLGSGTTNTKTYACTASACYYGQDTGGSQRNTNNSMFQGVPNTAFGTFPGNEFSFAEFNSSQIVADLSGATVDQVLLTVTNQHSWFNSGMTVALGYSNRSSFPSSIPSFGGGDHQNVQQYFISEGATLTTDITSNFATVLQNGNAKALMFGPSPTYSNLNYYGYFAGFSQSGAPSLRISYHTGAGNTTGGNGGNGQVKITYSTSQSLVASIATAAGTDQFGNAYPAGIAGVHAGTDWVSLQDNGTHAELSFGASGAAKDTGITRKSSGVMSVDGALSGKFYNAASPVQHADCSTNLSVTATNADVVGANVNVTVNGTSSTVVVTAVVDAQTNASAGANVVCTLDFNGTTEAESANIVGNGIRATIAQTWVITGLAAGTYNAKLQATGTAGGTIRSTHTGITTVVYEVG